MGCPESAGVHPQHPSVIQFRIAFNGLILLEHVKKKHCKGVRNDMHKPELRAEADHDPAAAAAVSARPDIPDDPRLPQLWFKEDQVTQNETIRAVNSYGMERLRIKQIRSVWRLAPSLLCDGLVKELGVETTTS